MTSGCCRGVVAVLSGASGRRRVVLGVSLRCRRGIVGVLSGCRRGVVAVLSG